VYYDTLSFIIHLTPEQLQDFKALSTSGFSAFDYEMAREKTTFQNRLGSYYAKLSMRHISFGRNEHSEMVRRRSHLTHAVRIEYSAHKWTIGVNGVKGFELTDKRNFSGLRLALQKIGVKWNPSSIQVDRVDVGRLYKVSNGTTGQLWDKIGRMDAPRRNPTVRRGEVEIKKDRYTEGSTVHASGGIDWGSKQWVYEKIYDKFAEQFEHRRDLPKELRQVRPQMEQFVPNFENGSKKFDSTKYLEYLENVIRYECEFKQKWLRDHDIRTLQDLIDAEEKKVYRVYFDRAGDPIIKKKIISSDFLKREGIRMMQLPQKDSVSPAMALKRYPALYITWLEIMKKGKAEVLAEAKLDDVRKSQELGRSISSSEKYLYQKIKKIRNLGVPFVLPSDSEELRIIYNTDTSWGLTEVA